MITYWVDFSDIEHVAIQHSDGSFTSMTKLTYDALKANEATTE